MWQMRCTVILHSWPNVNCTLLPFCLMLSRSPRRAIAAILLVIAAAPLTRGAPAAVAAAATGAAAVQRVTTVASRQDGGVVDNWQCWLQACRGNGCLLLLLLLLKLLPEWLDGSAPGDWQWWRRHAQLQDGIRGCRLDPSTYEGMGVPAGSSGCNMA